MSAGAIVAVVVALVILSAAGLRGGPAETDEPSAAPPSNTALSSASPRITLEPSPVPVETTAGTPDASPTFDGSSSEVDADLERSDQFWGLLVTVGGLYNFEYGSLADMTGDVDLIVRGRIAEVYRETVKLEHGTLDAVWASVAVDEVFKGIPESRADGIIDVLLWPANENWSLVRSSVPSHEHLFFLKNEEADLTRLGEPIPDADYARYTYWRPNDQSVLRNIDGRVSVVARAEIELEYGPDRFPLPLEGQPFAEMLDEVRQFVDSE